MMAVMLLVSSLYASDAFGARQKKLTFRQALIAAAEEARADGKIKTGDLMRLRIATLNPKVLAKMQDAAIEQAVVAKAMPLSAVDNLEAFDFTAILQFLKEFMPVLMELLKMFGMFGYDAPSADYLLCAYELQPVDYAFEDMLACNFLRGRLQFLRPLQWVRPLQYIRPRNLPGIRRLPIMQRGAWQDYVPATNTLCEGNICPA